MDLAELDRVLERRGRTLWRTVWRDKFVVVLVAAVVFCALVGVMLSLQPMYEGSTTLIGGQTGLEQSADGPAKPVQTPAALTRIAESDEVVTSAIEKVGLQNLTGDVDAAAASSLFAAAAAHGVPVARRARAHAVADRGRPAADQGGHRRAQRDQLGRDPHLVPQPRPGGGRALRQRPGAGVRRPADRALQQAGRRRLLHAAAAAVRERGQAHVRRAGAVLDQDVGLLRRRPEAAAAEARQRPGRRAGRHPRAHLAEDRRAADAGGRAAQAGPGGALALRVVAGRRARRRAGRAAGRGTRGRSTTARPTRRCCW